VGTTKLWRFGGLDSSQCVFTKATAEDWPSGDRCDDSCSQASRSQGDLTGCTSVSASAVRR
jgi:hypothetical protein